MVGGIAAPALVSRRILRMCVAATTVEEEDILEVEGWLAAGVEGGEVGSMRLLVCVDAESSKATTYEYG